MKVQGPDRYRVAFNVMLSAFSGMIGYLAFPPAGLAVLAWICMVPLFIVINTSGARGAFIYSYISGVVFFGCLLSWLVNVTVPGTVILVLALALFYGIFGLLTRYTLKYSLDLLILPFVWVILEYIRANILTGFPWGLLAYSQYTNIPLIQISDLTGAYGVSFVIIAFNAAVFAFIARRPRKVAYMAVALLFVIIAVAYGRYRQDNLNVLGSPAVSVIQGNIPQSMKWEASSAKHILDVYTELTEKAAADDTNMIVWPETSYPYLGENAGMPSEDISRLAAHVGTPVLAGMVTEEDGLYYNSAAMFTPDGRCQAVYRKTHLVPFGEYIPFVRYMSLLREYIDKPIGDFTAGEQYTLFPLPALAYSRVTPEGITRQTNFYKFGVLICFEDVFPYITREFVKKGADIMLNITNDAWFGRTAAAEQHLQASVFRAVENRVPVVRSANTGISCFIDPCGRVVSRVVSGGEDVFVRGYRTSPVDIYKIRSVYTVYGDIFVYFCVFMTMVLLVTEIFMAKKGGTYGTSR